MTPDELAQHIHDTPSSDLAQALKAAKATYTGTWPQDPTAELCLQAHTATPDRQQALHTAAWHLNRGLAITAANRYKHTTNGATGGDYAAVADAALWAAILTYNPDRGRFSSWAHLNIRRELQLEVRAIEHPHLSRDAYDSRPAVKAAWERLSADGSAPRPADVAAAVPVATAKAARRVMATAAAVLAPAPAVSLDEAVAGELGGVAPSAEDVVLGELEANRVAAAWETALSSAGLTDTELAVIVCVHGLDGREPLSKAEIGRMLGLSRERVRQIHDRALPWLQLAVEDAGLA